MSRPRVADTKNTLLDDIKTVASGTCISGTIFLHCTWFWCSFDVNESQTRNKFEECFYHSIGLVISALLYRMLLIYEWKNVFKNLFYLKLNISGWSCDFVLSREKICAARSAVFLNNWWITAKFAIITCSKFELVGSTFVFASMEICLILTTGSPKLRNLYIFCSIFFHKCQCNVIFNLSLVTQYINKSK